MCYMINVFIKLSFYPDDVKQGSPRWIELSVGENRRTSCFYAENKGKIRLYKWMT